MGILGFDQCVASGRAENRRANIQNPTPNRDRVRIVENVPDPSPNHSVPRREEERAINDIFTDGIWHSETLNRADGSSNQAPTVATNRERPRLALQPTRPPPQVLQIRAPPKITATLAPTQGRPALMPAPKRPRRRSRVRRRRPPVDQIVTASTPAPSPARCSENHRKFDESAAPRSPNVGRFTDQSTERNANRSRRRCSPAASDGRCHVGFGGYRAIACTHVDPRNTTRNHPIRDANPALSGWRSAGSDIARRRQFPHNHAPAHRPPSPLGWPRNEPRRVTII